MGYSGYHDDYHFPYHSHEDQFDSHENDGGFKIDHDDDSGSFRMDIFIPIVVCFVIFLLCTLCGVCCRKKRNTGAILSSPVIVTSSTHTTAAGPYPVTVAVPTATIQHSSAQYGQPGVYAMPQPQTGGYPAPYPPQQMQQSAPYPPTSAAGGSMPMPGGNPTGMNPPTYDQVVGNDAYQKQSPYNPGYNGN